MQVAGIGGGLAGGMGMGAAGGAANMAAGSVTGGAGIAGANTAATGLQSLADTMGDFSSAEILMAMMMASASNDKDESGGSAAMGFLVGLAMGAQVGQSMGGAMESIANTAGTGLAAAGIGAGLDLMA